MKHFCINPYFSRSIHDNKDIRCCWLQSNTDIQKLQQDILADRASTNCNKCWATEQVGLKSKRMIDNDNLQRQTGLSLTQLKSWAENTPTALNWQIQLSNDCNLACKTCYAHDSTRWYTEWNHYHTRKFKKVIKIDAGIADQLDYQHVKHIEFLGGEPFINNLHVAYLERLMAAGNTDLLLTYTTNGVKLPGPAVLDILKNFSQVNINISLDGIGARFDYLRYPADWNTVSNNVTWYKKNSQFASVNCMHTLSNMTIGYLDEFLPWALQHFGVRGYNFNVVHNPSYFAPHVLPRHVKEEIAKRYRAHKMHVLLEPFLSMMDSEPVPFTLGRFVIQALRQDTFRNQRMRDYLPEIVFFDDSRPLRKRVSKT